MNKLSWIDIDRFHPTDKAPVNLTGALLSTFFPEVEEKTEGTLLTNWNKKLVFLQPIRRKHVASAQTRCFTFGPIVGRVSGICVRLGSARQSRSSPGAQQRLWFAAFHAAPADRTRCHLQSTS